MTGSDREDDRLENGAVQAQPKESGGERIELRCPNCDHPVASVPRGHRFKERYLICPGCGLRMEPPDLDGEKERPAGVWGWIKTIFGR